MSESTNMMVTRMSRVLQQFVSTYGHSIAMTAFLFASSVLLIGCAGEPIPETAATEETTDAVPAAENEVSDETEPRKPVRRTVSDVGFREAARNGDLAKVEKAIEEGVDVNGADEDRRTALMLSAFDGHHRIVQLLLDHGARHNDRDATNRSALVYAASGRNPETVEVLLDAGADINVTDNGEGWTALMFAAAEGNVAVVRLLLAHGADRSRRDVDGETAKQFAAKNGHPEVVQLLQGN
jgi:ankyrin repeat protein